MTDEISATLSWFANYTNFYSVLCVILCFCVMVVFILRLNGEHFMGSSATHYNVVREQTMMSLNNPFSVQLSTQATSSLFKGLHIILSTTSEARAEFFWGVNIQSFQQELQLCCGDIFERFQTGHMFDKQYIKCDQSELLSPDCTSSEVSLQCPEGLTEERLGEPPRSLYPVVVAMVLNDLPIPDKYNTIVIQLTVIHLKDSLCSLDSHIVYQFVKTNHDKLISLQPIFLSAANQDDYSPQSTRSQNSTPENRNDSHASNLSKNGFNSTSHDSSCSAPTSNCNSTDPDSEKSQSTPQTSSSERVESSLNHIEILPGPENSDNSENTTTNDAHSDSDLDFDIDPESACCVCQTARIFYTLLPCRHACVCSSCIQLLDRCPMCRSYIDSYFRLDSASVPERVAEDLDSNPRPANRWEAWNQRLNEMLGLA